MLLIPLLLCAAAVSSGCRPQDPPQVTAGPIESLGIGDTGTASKDGPLFRADLRAANDSMQVLARDKSVDRGIGGVPAGPTQGLPYTPLGLRSPGRTFALRLCFWFCSYGWVISHLYHLYLIDALSIWQSCPATGPGHLRPSLWEVMMLGGKG